MQWHPLFAQLLRRLVEGHYEIRTGQTVGDLPRWADMVLLQRTAGGSSPFQGLWRYLTAWNLLEYKGLTVSARLSDLHDLVELGLGICRRLNELQRKDKQPEQECTQVSYWYIVTNLGSRYLAAAPDYLPGLQPLTDGVWRAEVLQHPVFLVSSQDVPVNRDSLPLHVLAGVAEKDRDIVTTLLRGEPHLWSRYGPWLSVHEPTIWQEILLMAAQHAEKLNLDYQPLIDFLRQSGDLKRFVEAVGVKQAVEAVGVKQIWENLSEQDRQELLRLAQQDSSASSQTTPEG